MIAFAFKAGVHGTMHCGMGAIGAIWMVEQSAVFAWYELLTTDVSAAQSFYGNVVGWDVQDASTPEFAYRLFSVGGTPVAGLMELPLDGRKKGATPRWMGYVAVEDLDGVVDQLRRLGGKV
jgi:uncharacterized protein